MTRKQRKPVEIPPQFKTLGDWVSSLANEGKNPQDMVQLTNCSKSYAYKFYNKARKAVEKTGVGEESSEVSIEEVKREVKEPTAPTKSPVELAEEKRERAQKLFDEKARPVIEEILTSGQVTVRTAGMLFKAVNFPLKKWYPRYAMSDEECLDLGSMWCPILNRKFKESIDKGEDLDLWFALLVTIMIVGSRYAFVAYDKFGGK